MPRCCSLRELPKQRASLVSSIISNRAPCSPRVPTEERGGKGHRRGGLQPPATQALLPPQHLCVPRNGLRTRRSAPSQRGNKCEAASFIRVMGTSLAALATLCGITCPLHPSRTSQKIPASSRHSGYCGPVLSRSNVNARLFFFLGCASGFHPRVLKWGQRVVFWALPGPWPLCCVWGGEHRQREGGGLALLTSSPLWVGPAQICT